MLFSPHALDLMPRPVLDAVWYNTVIMWMQCAFGLMPALENSEHTNEKLNNLIA